MTSSEKENPAFFPKSVAFFESHHGIFFACSPLCEQISSCHCSSWRIQVRFARCAKRRVFNRCALTPMCRAHHGSEYSGLMNEIKRKIQESTHDTTQNIDKLHREIQQKHEQDVAALASEIQILKREMNSQLAEILQVLRSKP